MRRSFFICFFICCIVNGFAQKKGYVYIDTTVLQPKEEVVEEDVAKVEPPVTSQEEIVVDSTLYIHEIVIPTDSITAWKNDPKYSYVKNLDSLLKVAAEKEKKDQNNTSTKKSDIDSLRKKNGPSAFENILSSGTLKIIFWCIAIGIVLFILYKLFFNQGVFRKDTAAVKVKEVNDEEDQPLPENLTGYDALIQQSFKLGDFRMSVRYLFLKTLLKLTDKGMLQRSVDKTNYQYVQEIHPAKRNEFASLVLKYEYVWYGHLNITREQFEEIEKGFTSFNNSI